MKYYHKPFVILILMICISITQKTEAKHTTEQEKIDYLISHIQNLQEAVFIRNGVTHSPSDAAGHLRKKLRRARKHIQSAEDFIHICATQSSITGRKYIIQFIDGESIESGIYLRKVLKEYTARANQDVVSG